jgi:hypothetical protein
MGVLEQNVDGTGLLDCLSGTAPGREITGSAVVWLQWFEALPAGAV